jgi:hypothetical protein
MQRFAIPFAGVALLALPHIARAEISCYPLARMEQALSVEYGESAMFKGSEDKGTEYRLYVNRSTGTWSWVGVPKGTRIACLIFAGRSKPDASIPPVETEKSAPPPVAQF